MAQADGFATGVFTPAHSAPAPHATGAQRLALRVLQGAGFAAVLAAVTYRTFELDRFFVPKELVLHLAALLVGLLCLGSARGTRRGRLDWLLAAFLLLSAASAALATNPWAATRALALSVSSAVLFWSARALARAGLGHRLVAALAGAVVLTAATALAQAYGVRLDVFSLNRAPGGTLGNRNFVAHACAFGMPVLVLCALRARRNLTFLAAATGFAATAAILVLSRSRAAWLGAAAALVVFGAGWLLSGPVRRHGRSGLRLLLLLVFAGGGVAAAILLPNRLRWTSDNPYADTAADLVNYQEGSGAGRLVQFRNSLEMAVADPLLGVGPGNWPVDYPRFAGRRDPSMDPREGGMTANPWPSSDWAAMVSERGFPATALLLGFFAGLGLAALGRAVRARDEREGLAAIALGATIAASLVVGMFDAVLLLALPALVIWSVLGALSAELPGPAEGRFARGPRFLLGMLLLGVCGAAAARSAGQIAAMAYFEEGSRAALETAVRLDPGTYRIRVRLARAYTGRRDCEKRREQADAAAALFPQASAPKALRRCRR